MFAQARMTFRGCEMASVLAPHASRIVAGGTGPAAQCRANDYSRTLYRNLTSSLPGISLQLIADAGIRIRANVCATNVVHAIRIR